MTKRRWVCIAAVIFAAGCSHSPYLPGYSFYPQPASVEVFRRGNVRENPLRVLVSIVGILNADAKHGLPYSVVMRMRLENIGSAQVAFDPRTLDLTTGTLQPLESAIVRPPQPVELSPGQRAQLDIEFPLPPGITPSKMNMRNLRLRWNVRINNVDVPQTALFERADPGYDADVYY